MQAMFIDVDGTLSSPCYKVNGKFQIGMSDVQWADYHNCPQTFDNQKCG